MRAALLGPSVVAALVALGLGCASGEAARKADAQATAEQTGAQQAPMCPMMVPGTEFSAEDTADGVAVNFTTRDEAQVEALRASVRDMVARHEARAQACPACERRQPGMGPPEGMGGAGMPAAKMTVEDIEGGARVVHVPEDPAQLDALREAVKAHVAQMQSGECPMKRSAHH